MIINCIFLKQSIWAFLAYLVGSIPTGYWFCKYLFDIDITKQGSGNIGATNVARALGSQKYFFIIFALDFLKSYLFLHVACSYIETSSINFAYILGALLIIGNGCSIFLGFRGGKGVSTALGTFAVLFPQWLFLTAICIWLAAKACLKQNGLAAPLTCILLPYIYLYAQGMAYNAGFWYLLGIAAWIIWRHEKNIKTFLGK